MFHRRRRSNLKVILKHFAASSMRETMIEQKTRERERERQKIGTYVSKSLLRLRLGRPNWCMLLSCGEEFSLPSTAGLLVRGAAGEL